MRREKRAQGFAPPPRLNVISSCPLQTASPAPRPLSCTNSGQESSTHPRAVHRHKHASVQTQPLSGVSALAQLLHTFKPPSPHPPPSHSAAVPVSLLSLS